VAGDVVRQVREFNRFYTNVIGVLRGGVLETTYSLTEARVLFELAGADATDVADLRRGLDIDAGYLSRILARFARAGLVAGTRSESDGRRRVIRLTAAGRREFATLDKRSSDQVGSLLSRLTTEDEAKLVDAMGTIRSVLDSPPVRGPVVLRAPESGDYGWVVERHGVIYAREYGWDETFEALVARIVSEFVEHLDRRHEAAWIAEVDGRRVGTVFCVRKEHDVAQLRLLLVEPVARGMGIGGRLVDECIRFARRAGYKRMVLWTNDVLADARRIYERAGFKLEREGRHHSFGADLVEQYWAVDL
jgi:DNA-binding MarR family transcriptional regulator/GNAT superfamily N-acetyltransferase